MSGKVGNNPYRASGVVADSAAEFDDDVIQSNIAMLGFKVAVNGSLVRYNLVDQTIDEYMDTSGVDAATSVNDARSGSAPYYYFGGAAATITEDADATGVDGDYTWYKWTDSGATGSYQNNTAQAVSWLIVGGGGGGAGALESADAGGGAGGGGYRTGASLSLTIDEEYTITVGAGGAGAPSGNPLGASGGDSILSGADITTVTSTGGGAGGHGGATGLTGGSGGGGGASGEGGAGNTPAITPITGETTTVQGFAGADGTGGPGANAGGGATAVGGQEDAAGGPGGGGIGGAGATNDITGEDVGFGGGGGGGAFNGDYGMTASQGGGAGGRGNNGPSGQNPGTNGTANTGGGGGGAGSSTSPGNNASGGNGGSGIVILKRLTSSFVSGSDMTLQSTDVTATAQPDYAEFVTLMEDGEGTATLNTDVKGYVSRDSGTTFTQGTLVNEGSWGTNKKILAFHDLDISGQPAGTSMCYKTTTHNQSAGSKETYIYATSLGWK